MSSQSERPEPALAGPEVTVTQTPISTEIHNPRHFTIPRRLRQTIASLGFLASVFFGLSAAVDANELLTFREPYKFDPNHSTLEEITNNWLSFRSFDTNHPNFSRLALDLGFTAGLTLTALGSGFYFLKTPQDD